MKTKDNRPFNFMDFNTTEREKYASQFRFDNLYPGELEMEIEALEEELEAKTNLIAMAENIKYTDPDREALYIKAQDEWRIVKKQLENARIALRNVKML